MRDFRVTTIFEGTTAIHSMYPALYFMRDILTKQKQMQLTKIATLIFLIEAIFYRTRWHTKFSEQPKLQAARISNSLAIRIRYMVLAGILFYREKIFTKQYFLRRITNLSIYLFAIVAMLARIESSRRAGYRIEEDLLVLKLFTEKARQVRKNYFHLLPSREESLNNDMTPLIIPE